MEEETKVEGKKIKLASLIVIILNAIAIICMLIVIGQGFIQERCTDTNLKGLIVIADERTFNSKFTPYQGRRTSSQLKQLVSVVNSNNFNNAGTDLIVTFNDKTLNNIIVGDKESGYIFNADTSDYYFIKCQISKSNGMVKNIIISDKQIEDDTTIIEDDILKIENKNEKYYIDFESGFNKIIKLLPIIIIYFVVLSYCILKNKKILKESYQYNEKKNYKDKNKILIIMFIIPIILSDTIFIIDYRDKIEEEKHEAMIRTLI